MKLSAPQSSPLSACVVIVCAVFLAYANSFSGPFVLDDNDSIITNESIRTLWPITRPLSPPNGGGLTVAGRPLLNFSLAINHAVSGYDVWGYHLGNVLIHAACAVLLYGVVRRTLLQPVLRERLGGVSGQMALLVALIWALHPLQTESVAYVIQRAESLCALWYLLTLYAYLRGVESEKRMHWYAVSWLACLAGMASKEIMVSAPLMVFLYDRTFVVGSFSAAWKTRWKYYLGLAVTWTLLISLVMGSHGRGGSAGFASGITWWNYALTQCRAIVMYVKLAVWPSPLVFDYGRDVVRSITEVWMQAGILIVLAVGALIAVLRKPVLGFCGCWFFALLAPSSSVVPVVTQTMAEHRMYLPLAALVVLAVAGVASRFKKNAVLWTGLAVAVALGLMTVVRNRDYRNELTLWQDTVEKRPQNSRARNNLGLLFDAAGRRDEALGQFAAAVELEPGSIEIHNNLANVLANLGRYAEALEQIEGVLRALPILAEAHDTKGYILSLMGRNAEAVASFREAMRLKPELADAHFHLAMEWLRQGRQDEAIVCLREAVRLKPDYREARDKLVEVEKKQPGR